MKTIEEHINFISTKLQVLLKSYAALQKENSNLIREVEKYKQTENEMLQKLDTLEIQTGILKSAAANLNDKEKHDLEKRINHYIKDLDKCMAMLNN